MRYATLLASVALVAGFSSSARAEDMRQTKLNLEQYAKGEVIVNIKGQHGHNFLDVKQQGSSAYANVDTSSWWNNTKIGQFATEGDAQVSLKHYTWPGSSTADVTQIAEKGNTTIDAEVRGVFATFKAKQAAGKDAAIDVVTGGHSSFLTVEQYADGNGFLDYETVVDEGSEATVTQLVQGDAIADFRFFKGYSPNWDAQRPAKDAAKINPPNAVDLY